MTFILAGMPQTEATMSTLPQTGAMMSTTPQRSAMMSPTVSSPPGFPSTPQYGGRQCQLQQYHNSPHLPVSLYEDGRGMMSPITANTLQLSSVFHNADITPIWSQRDWHCSSVMLMETSKLTPMVTTHFICRKDVYIKVAMGG